MHTAAVIWVGIATMAYGLVSKRLARSPLRAPLAFVGFGFLVGPGVFGVAAIDAGHGAIHLMAEITCSSSLGRP